MRFWRCLLLGLVVFTKPDGGRVWIDDTQKVAVIEMRGVGAAPTAIVTLAGTFYVKEPPEVVAAKFGWKHD